MDAYWLNVAVSLKGTCPCVVDGLNGFWNFHGNVIKLKLVLVKYAVHAYLFCARKKTRSSRGKSRD